MEKSGCALGDGVSHACGTCPSDPTPRLRHVERDDLGPALARQLSGFGSATYLLLTIAKVSPAVNSTVAGRRIGVETHDDRVAHLHPRSVPVGATGVTSMSSAQLGWRSLATALPPQQRRAASRSHGQRPHASRPIRVILRCLHVSLPRAMTQTHSGHWRRARLSCVRRPAIFPEGNYHLSCRDLPSPPLPWMLPVLTTMSSSSALAPPASSPRSSSCGATASACCCSSAGRTSTAAPARRARPASAPAASPATSPAAGAAPAPSATASSR